MASISSSDSERPQLSDWKLPVTPVSAWPLLSSDAPEPSDQRTKVYIVYMGSHDHVPVMINGRPTISNEDQLIAREKHRRFLASYLGSYDEAKKAIACSFTKHINGFTACLDHDVAEKIRAHPDVRSVFLNQASVLV